MPKTVKLNRLCIFLNIISNEAVVHTHKYQLVKFETSSIADIGTLNMAVCSDESVKFQSDLSKQKQKITPTRN